LPPVPSEDEDGDEKVGDFNFSHAECSLYFLHKLGSLLPSYLASSDRMEELRFRMQYLHRASTVFERKLRDEFKDHESKNMDLKDLENKKKVSTRGTFMDWIIIYTIAHPHFHRSYPSKSL